MSQNEMIRSMSDERLLEVVAAMDRVRKPLDQRFKGDDSALVDLMSEMNLKQDVVSKLLVTGEVLREIAHRGLLVPRPN